MGAQRHIFVCQHTSCVRQGSIQVLSEFEKYQSDHIFVSATECLGQCHLAPTVYVTPDEVWYCRVKSEDVGEIFSTHCLGGEPVKRLLHPRFHP